MAVLNMKCSCLQNLNYLFLSIPVSVHSGRVSDFSFNLDSTCCMMYKQLKLLSYTTQRPRACLQLCKNNRFLHLQFCINWLLITDPAGFHFIFPSWNAINHLSNSDTAWSRHVLTTTYRPTHG